MSNNVMDREILTPLRDEMFNVPWNIRFTQFRIGPMNVLFVLKDTNALPEEIHQAFSKVRDFKTGLPFKYKNFTCFCIVNDDQAYLINQFDDNKEAWSYMHDLIQRLKFGDRIQIRDLTGTFESIRFSYMGVDWIWI